MMSLVKGTMVGCCLVLAACGSKGSGDLRQLRVKGASLVEADSGTSVTLRGVAFTSGVWSWDFQHPEWGSLTAVQYMQDESDFARVRGWGANAVTLYLNWYWFQTEDGWAWLDRTFEWCRRNHLYVVPSLVVYPVGGQRGGPTFWASAQARADVIAFWTQFATRYRGRAGIAGVEILNEPQGTEDQAIAAYEVEIVDAIRAIDPDLVIFLDGQWGNPWAMETVRMDRPGLVYVAHFYDPLYYSAQGFYWIENGNVPEGTRYPGEMVTGTVPAESYEEAAVAGAAGAWVQQEVEPTLSFDGDLAFPYFFVLGAGDGTVELDAVEWSVQRSGETAWTEWEPALNGGFEAPVPTGEGDDAVHWFSSWNDTGAVVQLAEGDAYAGSRRAILSGCDSRCTLRLWSEGGFGTAGGIPIWPGDRVRLRYQARFQNAPADALWAGFEYAYRTSEYWDKERLGLQVKSALADFSRNHQVPVLVGEFSPSLIAPRPDSLHYADDLIDAFEENGLSWMFYPYRENWPKERRYLGIFDGPAGKPTADCYEDVEIRDLVKARLR